MLGSVAWQWKPTCKGRGRLSGGAGVRERGSEGLLSGPGPTCTPSLGSWEVSGQVWVGLGCGQGSGRRTVL